jgi:hypothetical protein
MWEMSPKTPHTQFLCCFQLYKLPLKTNRVLKYPNLNEIAKTIFTKMLKIGILKVSWFENQNYIENCVVAELFAENFNVQTSHRIFDLKSVNQK